MSDKTLPEQNAIVIDPAAGAGLAAKVQAEVDAAVEPNQESWIFTFGSGQQYDGRYVVVPGSPSEAREEMLRRFGRVWSFMYSAAEREVLERYGMVELPRAEWPATLVDRAITALTSFGVTTEREAGRLLPMWLHYREMSGDDCVAVYRHYRQGGAR